jgi:hypothetical protein
VVFQRRIGAEHRAIPAATIRKPLAALGPPGRGARGRRPRCPGLLRLAGIH